jgi:hypothetical protein
LIVEKEAKKAAKVAKFEAKKDKQVVMSSKSILNAIENFCCDSRNRFKKGGKEEKGCRS